MIFKRCGHTRRQRDSCGHPWWAQVRHHLRRHQVSLEKYGHRLVRGRGSKSVALDLARQLTSAIRAGEYPSPPAERRAAVADLTVSEFLDVYTSDYVQARQLASYATSERWRLEQFRRRWGSQRISAIQHADIETYLVDIRKTGARPSTVKRYFARLSHMFRWAERQGYLERTPIQPGKFDLQPENNERSRRPSSDELNRILDAADPFLRDYLLVKLDTGLRRGSLLNLQFKHVRWDDGRQGVLSLPPRLLKQGKGQRIPLTTAARAVMERRLFQLGDFASDDAYVFGDAAGTRYRSATPIVSRWNAALKKTGLKDAERGIDVDLHEHDLRGECASRLKDPSVNVSVIQRFLGHSSLAMTQRYLRPRVGELEDAADALEQYGLSEEPTIKPTVAGSGTPADAIAASNATPVLLSDGANLDGAEGQNRTADTMIFSHVLYRLSYLGPGMRLLEGHTL